MSYNRRYIESISKTVSVSYPGSENGGSTSVTVDIPVEVNILVDTNPFDKSVNHCNTNVNFLTGAVVATEAAQVKSIDVNSKKIAGTIVDGFFSYIRSEISQQTTELSQHIEAQLMHLKELANSCLAKKKQMEGDYVRISSRYIKIFTDLNNELSNRIFELDKSTFTFKKETDSQNKRASQNDLVNIVAIFGLESGELQSKISASIAKKRAFDTLNQAKNFLWQQKMMNDTIQQSMLNENITTSKYCPICFMETTNNKSEIVKNLYLSNYLSALKNKFREDKLINQFSDNYNVWNNIPRKYSDSLSLYFNSELNNKYATNDQHSLRVKEMIQNIATFDSMKIIENNHI